MTGPSPARRPLPPVDDDDLRRAVAAMSPEQRTALLCEIGDILRLVRAEETRRPVD